MNKLQWTVMILSGFGLFLYLIFGIGKPFNHWINIIIYIILGVAIVICFYLAFKQRYCSKCGARLPRIRKPQDTKQALYGGWICHNCKSVVDSSGNLVKKQ